MDATIKYIDLKGREKTIKVRDIRFLEPASEYLEHRDIGFKKVIDCCFHC